MTTTGIKELTRNPELNHSKVFVGVLKNMEGDFIYNLDLLSEGEELCLYHCCELGKISAIDQVDMSTMDSFIPVRYSDKRDDTDVVAYSTCYAKMIDTISYFNSLFEKNPILEISNAHRLLAHEPIEHKDKENNEIIIFRVLNKKTNKCSYLFGFGDGEYKKFEDELDSALDVTVEMIEAFFDLIGIDLT